MQKQYSPNESRKARYLRAVRCFQWPILTSIQFNAPILRTANCPFVTDQSLKNTPHKNLQLQCGKKKQTNKNWVVLTSCLLSLRFTARRRAEEWAEISVLLLMRKTIFTDRLELTRMIHSGQQFPSELSLNSVFSRQLVRYSSYCCSVLTGAPRFKSLSTSPISASRPSPSSTLPTPPAYYRKHDVTPTLVPHVPLRITLLIMQTETWQKMAVQWHDNV